MTDERTPPDPWAPRDVEPGGDPWPPAEHVPIDVDDPEAPPEFGPDDAADEASGTSAPVEAPQVLVPTPPERTGDDSGARPPRDAASRAATPQTWYGRLGRRGRRVFWAAFVVWLGVGSLLVVSLTRRAGQDAGPVRPTVPSARLLLVAVVDGDGGVQMLSLLHSGPAGSSVVLLPTGTVVELPGDDPRPFSDTLRRGGEEGLVTAVANALGISVPDLAVGGTDDLARLADPAREIEVIVPETLDVERGGVLRTLYTAGATPMDGATVRDFMLLRLEDEDEPARLARQAAAWQGIFAAIAERDVPDPFDGWAGSAGTAAGGVLAAVASDPARTILSLPVERAAISGADVDLYSVDRSQLDAVQQSLDDVRTVRDVRSRRVRLVVAASGAVGPAVARDLIEGGYAIVLTRRSEQPADETVIAIAENTPELLQRGEHLRALLGVGKVGVLKDPQSLFDVNLVVGRDWAEANGFRQS